MKAKYKRGKQLRSVADFENSKAECFRIRFGDKEKTLHRGFIDSWQYHYLRCMIKYGRVFEADPVMEEKNASG